MLRRTEKQLGPVAGWTQSQQPSLSDMSPSPKGGSIMPLEVCQSLEDIEKVGLQKLSPRGRVYFESAAESLTSHRRNREDWATLSFRPRVLRNVTYTSMQCRIMGSSSSLPIFVAPAAAAKLGHEQGELCLTRGAARMAIPQCVCTYSSISQADIVKCFQEDPDKRGGALFFQLYVPKLKKDAEKLISKAKGLGFDALIVTVDSPVIGKRTDDDRLKAAESHAAGIKSRPIQPQLPAMDTESPRAVHCSNLEWSDLPWIRGCWGKKPIILKGIQTVDDALEATKYDVDAIYLSNHGGRQLDFAPSSVQTLLEIRKQCPQVFNKIDVYVDGGVTRGSDVVKALCLGARAVGIGRGFMYALSAYGTEGVLRAIESKKRCGTPERVICISC
jgi:L-lactate dehydrogenase (cytochrome)